jgi:hypothetical protein
MKELESKKETNMKMKNEITLTILQRKEEKMRQIMEEAKLLKEQRVENEKLLKLIKKEEQDINKRKVDEIKYQHLNGKEKRKQIEVIFLNK